MVPAKRMKHAAVVRNSTRIFTRLSCSVNQLAPALHQLAPPDTPPPRDMPGVGKGSESLRIQQNESWFLLQTTLTTLRFV